MFSTVTGITKQADGELTTPWQAGNNKVNYQQYWDNPVTSRSFALACNVWGCYLGGKKETTASLFTFSFPPVCVGGRVGLYVHNRTQTGA